jgi:REP element-mobilizing transposase RayT
MGAVRRARYIAPWQRPDFELLLAAAAGGGPGEGAQEQGASPGGGLSAEALAALRGKPAIYHVISRVVDRQFVFGREEKEHFVGLMRLYERFCGLRVLTFAVMSNHFHILLEVPSRPQRPFGSEREFLDQLGILYPEGQLREIGRELELRRGHEAELAAYRERFLGRMWDLSQFMKTLKQRFSQWFNRRHGRRGVLWEERFRSVLVEDGHAARVVAAYIDLNPLRAGLVDDPADYRWSGYGEAVAGGRAARAGLRRVMIEWERQRMDAALAAQETADWRKVIAGYRVVLFRDAGESPEGARAAGARGAAGPRRGIAAEKVAEVLKRQGRMSEAQLLGRRVRYFADGLVIGSAAFVDRAWRLTRAEFGPARKSGARRLRGLGLESGLRSMRDLQADVYG